MVALTYDDAHVPGVETAPQNAGMAGRAESTAPRKHWFQRLLDAMIEARMQQARREVNMYASLIPDSYEENGNRKLKADMNEQVGGW